MYKYKVLILCQNQWGYHVDTYKYGCFLAKNYEVTYLCWDYGYDKVDNSGVTVKYISREGSLIKRNMDYIKLSLNELSNVKFDLCFIKYFRGCSILKLIHQKLLFIFDIRTGYVGEGKLNRLMYDKSMVFESYFFKHITVISASLANNLNLENKAHILPLGSEVLSPSYKNIDSLKLIYIGTLTGRDLVKVIDGLALFINKHRNIDVTLSIVGDGRELEDIKRRIELLDLTKQVHLLGRIPFCDLGNIIDSHNVGISFVPMKDCYDCQPVTKTFDYLLSGMPVLATSTSENIRVIDDSNGLCINDTPDAFASGLFTLWERRNSYCSSSIRNRALVHSWDNILASFDEYLVGLIEEN